MIERCAKFAGALLVVTQAVWFAGCSSSDPPPATNTATSTSTSTSTGTGGATGSGGSTAASGGTTTASGGATGTGGGAAATCTTSWPNPYNTDADCKSIKGDQACLIPGKMCPDLVCGLADSGRRNCTCDATTSLWKCEPCSFANSGFKTQPATVPACVSGEKDKLACTAECSVCAASSGEICACAKDDEQTLIWDCDTKPSSWM